MNQTLASHVANASSRNAHCRLDNVRQGIAVDSLHRYHSPLRQLVNKRRREPVPGTRHDLLEIMLESLMVAERGEFLWEQEDRNKGNGYRLGLTYRHGTPPSSLEHPFAPQEAHALGGHHHRLAG